MGYGACEDLHFHHHPYFYGSALDLADFVSASLRGAGFIDDADLLL